ncbi:hypothetical protein, partial [Chryseobacterium sp. Leaf394]|uniref:hypothetical protein n=1 Tax=Chryseobacterium sp. Leaf394 TaxID=1736361 RepID=UPI0006F34570
MTKEQRKTPYNSGLAKVAVQCSADTFVVNQSLFSASTFVVKIATFAKPRNVTGNFRPTTTLKQYMGLDMRPMGKPKPGF